MRTLFFPYERGGGNPAYPCGLCQAGDDRWRGVEEEIAVSLPTVVLFATGGTISSLEADSAPRVYAPALAGGGLLERVRGYAQIANVEVVDYTSIGSNDMTPAMVLDLCRRVRTTLARSDVTGVVITHGTATLEDTCFLADILLESEKPVIGTGAMYSASSPEWDGRRNILDSLTAAVAPVARGKGVMVCMNGELHAARDVLKMHASSPAAFVSPGTGPLGVVDEGKVILYRSPSARHAFSVESLEARVEVIKVTQGSDVRVLHAMLGLGIHGLVLEGLPGRGALPSSFRPLIRDARENAVPVVLCTRSPTGRVTFAGPIDMVELGETGVIPGGDLPAHKARLLLMVALAQTRNEDRIRSIFAAVAP